MKRIVVTGATSFIGVHLIDEWTKEKCEIFAVVRPNSKNIERLPKKASIYIVELKMEEYNKLPLLIHHADYFYHLSWEGTRAPDRDDKAMQRKNYECTMQAFDSAMNMGCSFFLSSGSQAEYGTTNGIVGESYPCNPDTEYGKEKLHAYNDLLEKTKGTSIKFIWTRIFSIYGKYDYPKTLIMSSIDKMKRNETIEMTSCTQLWDYLHVEDVARVMKLFAMKNCENGVYNIASGKNRALKEFVEIVKRVSGSESELNFGVVSYGSNGPVNLMPNVEKVKKALEWEPKISFDEGIIKILEWEKNKETSS